MRFACAWLYNNNVSLIAARLATVEIRLQRCNYNCTSIYMYYRSTCYQMLYDEVSVTVSYDTHLRTFLL